MHIQNSLFLLSGNMKKRKEKKKKFTQHFYVHFSLVSVQLRLMRITEMFIQTLVFVCMHIYTHEHDYLSLLSTSIIYLDLYFNPYQYQ